MVPRRSAPSVVLIPFLVGSAAVLSVCLDGRTSTPGGQRCDGDDDCPDSLVCQYDRCRGECAFDRDCEEGVCLPPETEGGPRVCSLPDEGACPCSEGACIDGVCVPGPDPVEPDGDADGDHDAVGDGDGDAADDAPPVRPCFDIAAPAVIEPGDMWHDDGHLFDVTAGPLTLEVTVDLSGVGAPFELSWLEVGLRQPGEADFNPGISDLYRGSVAGWMTLHVDNADPSPEDQTIHDKLCLTASGDRGEGDYDVLEGPELQPEPFGTFHSHGIWFDRDSVDPWQAEHWGMIEGGTYGTAGRYAIRVTYLQLEPSLGAMMATVNDVPTGFWIGEWRDEPPDLYPAGLAFRADLTALQLFAGFAGGASGSATLSGMRVCGWTTGG